MTEDSKPERTADQLPRSRTGFPSRLTSLARKWSFLIAIMVIFAILPLGFSSSYALALLFFVALYMSMAQSWNIAGGYSGQLSFGHWGFLGLGAYVFVILAVTFGWPVLAAMLLSALVTFIVGYVVGYLGSALRGAYFAVATLAAAALVQLIILNWSSITLGSHGFPLFYLIIPSIVVYYGTLALALIATIIVVWISSTRFGLALESIRENEDTALASGVNTRNFKALALAISASIMGPAGGLYALNYLYIDPSGTNVFNLLINLQLILMVIVGGRGKVLGPIIGATIMGLIFEIAIVSFSAWQYIITGVLICVLTLVFPRGILGLRWIPAGMRG